MRVYPSELWFQTFFAFLAGLCVAWLPFDVRIVPFAALTVLVAVGLTVEHCRDTSRKVRR